MFCISWRPGCKLLYSVLYPEPFHLSIMSRGYTASYDGVTWQTAHNAPELVDMQSSGEMFECLTFCHLRHAQNRDARLKVDELQNNYNRHK